MKTISRYLKGALRFGAVALAAALYAGSGGNTQAAVTYTDYPSFVNALQYPSYLETFNSQPGDFEQGPQTYTLGGIGFTLTDVGSGYIFYSTGGAGQGSVFPTGLSYTDTFRITFTGNIYAVGGTFFLSTPSFIPESGGTVTATLATGETITLNSTNSYGTEPFGGFSSTTPITSLTLVGTHLINGMGAYLSLDNLVVSGLPTAVPEPGTCALVVAAGGLGVLARRRRFARA